MEGAIKNEQSRETDNIGYTRRRQKKPKHPTQYVLDTTMRKKRIKRQQAFPETTGGKDESNIIFVERKGTKKQ